MHDGSGSGGPVNFLTIEEEFDRAVVSLPSSPVNREPDLGSTTSTTAATTAAIGGIDQLSRLLGRSGGRARYGLIGGGASEKASSLTTSSSSLPPILDKKISTEV